MNLINESMKYFQKRDEPCKHEWVCIEKPKGHRSGWHVDQCKFCQEKREYDTSD